MKAFREAHPSWAAVQWVFWHPVTRTCVSLLAMCLALVLYAEDPVGHSEQDATLSVAGPIVNLVVCALWLDGGCLITVISVVSGGVLLGRLVIHPLLRDRLRLAAFGFMTTQQLTALAKYEGAAVHLAAHRSKGRFSVVVVVVSSLLIAATHLLPVVSRALGSSSCLLATGVSSCRLSPTLLISNATYTRLTAALTLALDLFSMVLLLETMLQEGTRYLSGSPPPFISPTLSAPATFAHGFAPQCCSTAGSSSGQQFSMSALPIRWEPAPTKVFVADTSYLTRAPQYKAELSALRRWESRLRCRGTYAPPSVLAALSVLFVSSYMMHTGLLRWVGSCSELGRIFLASCRLFADVTIVLQDWEFPHFRQLRRISLGNWFDSHVTGKWLNFGVLGCTLLLDVNNIRYHWSYNPAKFGQHIQRDTGLVLSPKDGRRFRSAYAFFSGYGTPAKLCCTFPVFLALALLLVGLRHWRIRGLPVGNSLNPSTQMQNATSPVCGGVGKLFPTPLGLAVSDRDSPLPEGGPDDDMTLLNDVPNWKSVHRLKSDMLML